MDLQYDEEEYNLQFRLRTEALVMAVASGKHSTPLTYLITNPDVDKETFLAFFRKWRAEPYNSTDPDRLAAYSTFSPENYHFGWRTLTEKLLQEQEIDNYLDIKKHNEAVKAKRYEKQKAERQLAKIQGLTDVKEENKEPVSIFNPRSTSDWDCSNKKITRTGDIVFNA